MSSTRRTGSSIAYQAVGAVVVTVLESLLTLCNQPVDAKSPTESGPTRIREARASGSGPFMPPGEKLPEYRLAAERAGLSHGRIGAIRVLPGMGQELLRHLKAASYRGLLCTIDVHGDFLACEARGGSVDPANHYDLSTGPVLSAGTTTLSYREGVLYVSNMSGSFYPRGIGSLELLHDALYATGIMGLPEVKSVKVDFYTAKGDGPCHVLNMSKEFAERRSKGQCMPFHRSRL